MTAEAEQNKTSQNTAEAQKLGGFTIVGVTTRTTNKDGKATDDINTLWQRFFEEAVGEAIPAKDGEAIYAVYHDYAGDHEAAYSLTIGCRVKSDDFALTDGLSSVFVEGGDYLIFAAQGEQPKALIETWQSIWKTNLPRTFKTDVEIYGPRFFEEGLHEVLICVGVKA